MIFEYKFYELPQHAHAKDEGPLGWKYVGQQKVKHEMADAPSVQESIPRMAKRRRRQRIFKV
jgi:hypothetical protein